MLQVVGVVEEMAMASVIWMSLKSQMMVTVIETWEVVMVRAR